MANSQPEVPRQFVEQAERERAEVIALAERVGYGFMIDVAAREWDAKLERLYGITDHSSQWLAIFAESLKPKKQKARRKLRRQRPSAETRAKRSGLPSNDSGR